MQGLIGRFMPNWNFFGMILLWAYLPECNQQLFYGMSSEAPFMFQQDILFKPQLVISNF